MFTDLEGYASEAHADEAGALQSLREQEKLVRPLLTLHRGRKIKSMGDGLLIEFPNARDAVECAVELQRSVHDHNAREGIRPLRMRVGIHLGDVEPRGTDILGDAVNIASRIEPLAEVGGVCLSAEVFAQVHHQVAYKLETIGTKNLKGIREPIEVYRVILPWSVDETSAKNRSIPRLAVLPLTNISPDPKDEYFADGLTEEMITVLSQIKGLRVISRTSVTQYKTTSKPIAQIGSELGADAILEGSVRKSGDQLRIAVQLIDTRTDEHRWAQTYDRKLENVFAIQSEVAERTASALKVQLLSSERQAIQERPTSNLRAYESYLQGIQAFRRCSEGFAGIDALDRETEKYFDAAIREDPQFSAAYSYLANHLLAVLGQTRSARDVVPRVRELVATALALNPDSSDAHTALGNLVFQADLDWPRAEAEFQQAIALNPSSSTARFWYAYLLGVLQRFDEAKKQYRIAIDLDPLWLLPRTNLAWIHAESGDIDATIASLEKLSEQFGEIPFLRIGLAWAHACAGHADDALRAVVSSAAATDPTSRLFRSAVLAVLGQPAEARTLLAEWEAGQLGTYLSPSVVAGFYAIWGDPERALSLLEGDYREGDRTLWNVYQGAQLDPLRGEPRFVALLRAMNLPTGIPTRRMLSVVRPDPSTV